MPAPVILKRLMDRMYQNATSGRFWECRLNGRVFGLRHIADLRSGWLVFKSIKAEMTESAVIIQTMLGC